MLPATRRGRPFGFFGSRSYGKGVFFRFCRGPGRAGAGWENLAARIGAIAWAAALLATKNDRWSRRSAVGFRGDVRGSN